MSDAEARIAWRYPLGIAALIAAIAFMFYSLPETRESWQSRSLKDLQAKVQQMEARIAALEKETSE